MRVAFLGSQSIGAACLRVVLDGGHDVVGVATFSPQQHEMWGAEVDRLIVENGLPRLDVLRFGDPAEVRALEATKPDLTVVVGWRWLLPAVVLRVPPLGTIGIHGSLLPRLRGFAPVNWALIRDEERTGPTLFYIDEGMDTGDIIASRPFPLTDEDDAASVRSRIESESVTMLADTLPLIAAGTAPRTPQKHSDATVGEQRRPGDGRIDWTRTSREIFNLVRALSRPYPGAFTQMDETTWTIWRTRMAPTSGSASPGTVLHRGPDGQPTAVATMDGTIEITDVERRASV